MFQAKLRGWRRLAAGLVLVPGLTGLGADALGLLGRAAGQDRSSAARTEEAREIMRRAREAYEARNYGLAERLAKQAQSLQAPSAFYDDSPDEMLGDLSRKPGARPIVPAAASGATARPTSSDPRVLMTLAKQAMDAGDLNRAQDLCMQAQATGANVRWGLFDDTPASLLKDIHKARGRRDRDASEKLLAEARQLVERPAASKNERIANLNAAEEKALRAGSLHGTYSMWDFGDRPGDVVADVRKAREKEKLFASKPAATDFPDDPPMPKGPTNVAGRKTGARDDRGMTADAPKPTDVARRKAATVLMQEGKALEVGFHYGEARKKYAEAARLNAVYGKDEDTPEIELARLNVAAQRHINALMDKARSCMDRKDATAATAHLDEAHSIALGMGLDASVMVEMRAAIKAPSPVVRTGGKTDDGPAPIIRNGHKPLPDETADGAPATKPEELPPPVIRSGRRPMPDETTQDGPPPIIRTGRPPMADEKVEVGPPPSVKPETDPSPIIRTGRRPMADETADIIPPKITNGNTPDAPPPLPPIPDVDKLGETAKPPAIGPTPVIRTNPAEQTAKGQELLKIARNELKKGETETAKRIAIEVINGPYGCKDEAVAVLKSAETEEAASKLSAARRAFENGMEQYQTHNYTQALAIFKQIDGLLLPPDARKKLSDMTELAAAKSRELEDATAARNSEKLPAAPKPAPGIPDVPTTGPAPTPRVGSDNLLKQQEALAQVEFQRLRSKALKVESEATARFGRGETDAALQDLRNFVAEVKASGLEVSKQNMLVRPVEARMDRLMILKHQTDFLTKEAKDRINFKAEMTQDAMYKQKKIEEVAQLMKSAHKLMDEAKHKEAYVELQKAQALDPDDPAVSMTLKMCDTMIRKKEFQRVQSAAEKINWEQINGLKDFPLVSDKDPLVWTEDKDTLQRLRNRGPGSLTMQRSRTESEKSIERKLSTPVSVNFKAMPLEGVVEHLQTMTAINFDLDLRGLKEGNVDPKQPISAKLDNVSLKSALDIVCRQAGLKHVIESEAIRVTTPKNAAGRQIVKSIPVGDLVIPAPNYGAKPGMTFSDTIRMATEAAFNTTKSMTGASSMRTPGSLPNGSDVSNSMGLPGPAGRLTNTPEGGGASSNTGPVSGTLERELIRLITTTIKPDSWTGLGGEGSIEYYPLGLALVINQSPEVIEEVERLLESLRKLQDLEVSIEVKVVSLAETFYERIGVDFSLGVPTNAHPVGGPLTGQEITGVSTRNFSGNVVGLQLPHIATPDLDIPIRPTSFARAVPPFGGFTNSFQEGGIALGLAFLSECQVQMFMEAAQGDTRTNVMHAPKLTALNGTSASMTVGDFQFFVTGITPVIVSGQLVFVPQNVPFLTGTAQPTPPNVSVQNGLLNFTPTAPQTPGMGLFIQPVVSADRRFVRLNIQQSFTSLISGSVQTPLTTIITPQFENGGTGQPVPFTQFLQQPRFSNLETQTVVVVPDGGTVVMGGLKYMTEGRNEFGPPVLSKIPYLNRLFKNVAYGREGRSILIMVTPRVIINREEQERQTGVREDDMIGLVGP